jgi:hypothetical protein
MAFIIHLVPGTPRTGLWCPTCLLPSGVEVPLHFLTDTGCLAAGTVRECFDCGATLPPEDTA